MSAETKLKLHADNSTLTYTGINHDGIGFEPANDHRTNITELNVPYTVLEILVAFFAIVGNAMVIIVFHRERRLRRRTNYYIVSLALADLLVGLLGIPFAILASIGLPTNLYTCLFTVSLLIVLCTISIFCLVAVSIDRYWAILYPLAYSRNIRTKTVVLIVTFCWVLGSIVGFLPLFGWHAEPNQACLFVKVMDYNYLVFLYVATIITPAILLLAFYVHIYTVIIKQVRQTITITAKGAGNKTTEQRISITKTQGGSMLRVLGAARKREVKATQNLSIIVLFFMMCWFPLYTINCIKAFCPDCYVPELLTYCCIVLSHLNSAVNPVLYAYHLKDFRAALKSFIFKIFGKEIQQPDINYRFSIASQRRFTSLLDQKRNSMQPKIYVNSPVWLRQQQHRTEIESISPLHFNKKSNNQLWKIVEQDYISDNQKEDTSATNACTDVCLKNQTSSLEKSIPGDAYSDMITNREYTFNYDHLDQDALLFKKYQENLNSNLPENNNQTDLNRSNSFKDLASKSMNDLNISLVCRPTTLPPKQQPPKNQFGPIYCPYINLISPKFTNKMTYMLSKNHHPPNILPAVSLSKSYSHSDSNVSQCKAKEPSPVSSTISAVSEHILTDAKQSKCDCSTSNPDISI
ncbi:5-hydroxytryptamine receptor 7 [Bradysia coprophila]|uniref:5-hydroxytryptamine receptor 7 n=1 Tax=Bradysia coprophila TaxID=38358 RepID=UPI00187DA872|nr:5-hydroxytryptamine receptor 7 [Bradysia coprophila]